MAVSIPKLQRIQPSKSLPTNERINIQAPNVAGDILSRTNAVAGLAEKGIDLAYDIEDSKIAELSNKVEQDYVTWNTEQLARLKNYEGDPTDAYVEYDKLAAEKREEILNSRPDLNNRVKSHLTTNLDKVIGGQNLHALKQRGAQIETYKNNVFESNVKLKKNELGNNIGYINAADPGSFLPMDQNIADIKTTIAKRGFDTGLAKKLPDDAKTFNHFYKDEEGKIVKVELTPMGQQKVAKELSEGVRESLSAMLATATTEEAKANYQAAYERYKPYLDPKGIAALNKGHKDSVVNDAAYKEVGKIELLPPDQRFTAIEKISDPETRSKALAILKKNEVNREYARDKKEERNYEFAMKVSEQVKKDGKPFLTVLDAMEDPRVKRVWDNLNSKQKKAFEHSIVAPEESDPKAKLAMQELFLGNDNKSLKSMTPEKFNEMLVGLNKSDRTRYTDRFEKFKTDTAGEINSLYSSAGKDLEKQLLMDEHIERDKYGKIRGEDELTLLKAQSNIEDYIDNNPNLTRKELRDFIKQNSAELIKEKFKESITKQPISAPSSKSAAVNAPAPKGEILLTAVELVKYKKMYVEKFGGPAPLKTDPKFQTFLQNNYKK